MNEWRRYEARGIGPSGRAMHTATAVGRKIYFFGGANSSGTRRDTSAFCDLYELDVGALHSLPHTLSHASHTPLTRLSHASHAQTP